ncbi:MAG: hypothetical protein ACM3KH_00030 [Thiobacillus sp.]
MKNNPDKKKIIIIVSSIVAFVITLSIMALVLALNFKPNIVLGKWQQTAAGLGFDEEVGPYPDYVDFKNDGTVTWYANSNDKTKDYMEGKYTVVTGNKTGGKDIKTVGGDTALYTVTIKPSHYLDETGKDNPYSGNDLEYLVYKNNKEPNSIGMMSSQSLRGYLLEKQK